SSGPRIRSSPASEIAAATSSLSATAHMTGRPSESSGRPRLRTATRAASARPTKSSVAAVARPSWTIWSIGGIGRSEIPPGVTRAGSEPAPPAADRIAALNGRRERFDLARRLRPAWRYRWLALGLIVALPVAAYALSSLGADRYRATATVTTARGGSSDVPGTTLTLAVARSDNGAPDAARRLDEPRNAADALLAKVHVTNPKPLNANESTNTFTLAATAAQPGESARIANAFAESLVAATNSGAGRHATKPATLTARAAA